MIGSKDNTRQLVEEFIKEDKFNIQYYSQENKGKMAAINEIVSHATGNFIIECDSDDYFSKDAFITIKDKAKYIDNNTYALCFLKFDENGNNMGNNFEKNETTMFDLYFKQGEPGEKALVFNATIRKKHCYQLENNEKFVTEARMHHQMDLQYKIKCFNDVIMICEYQEQGYTNKIKEIFKNNPYGYYEYFKEMFEHNQRWVLFSKRVYMIKHYILFCCLTNRTFFKSNKNIKGIINKIMFWTLYLPGKVLTKIKFK